MKRRFDQGYLVSAAVILGITALGKVPSGILTSCIETRFSAITSRLGSQIWACRAWHPASNSAF
jgi:hypothetical protein